MPRFTDRTIDNAFERFMQQKPNFNTDAPEADIIQRDLDRKKQKREVTENDLPGQPT